jgi:hypothetical protein
MPATIVNAAEARASPKTPPPFHPFRNIIRNIQGANDTQESKDGCKAELETYCKDVTPGEGRLAACLKKNEKALSDRCQQAMKDLKRDFK